MADSKYYETLEGLFRRAYEKNPYDMLCTLLRVGGMSTSNWDPFVESRKAFEDYFYIIEKLREERGENFEHRIALVAYCQAVEMTAPHEILANIARILSGENYVINSLSHLGRTKKKDIFYYVPPSAKVKYRFICDKFRGIDERDIANIIEHIYNDSIRNSFTHSDYIIEGDEYRYTKGRISTHMSSEDLMNLINDCFDFTRSLMNLHKVWLKKFSLLKRYHKWPQYEVLELISDDEGVYGFSVHFSNGSKAMYSRRVEGVEAINIMFNSDGTVKFMCGNLDKLEPVWKIDGKEVTDWDSVS